MKNEILLAFNQIAERSKIGHEVLIEALESALVTAYRRSVNASNAQAVEAKVTPETGDIRIFAEKEVVDDVHDERTEVRLPIARQYDADVQLGDVISVDSTPSGFGRIAAQTAKQVILQRVREAERESQYQEYVEREGEIVHGTVQSINRSGVTLSLGRAEALMPQKEQMPHERFKTHEKVRAYVVEVKKTTRGPQIIISRTHKNMLRRLLEMEVPEIYTGTVEIKSIAREAGYRSKVAVAALQPGVDPVGACVGMRGVRIQSIVRELNDEKIDVIEWNPDQSAFIAKSLSPARVSGVYLDDDPIDGRTATVIVPDDQLSLAIGREGQNARLSAKLTGWRIDIKSLTEASGEAVRSLQTSDAFADLAAEHGRDLDQVAVTMGKIIEKKPVMPEEYAPMQRLVHAYESKRLELRIANREVHMERLEAIRAEIPARAYRTPIDEVEELTILTVRAFQDAGFETAGHVLETLLINPDRLLAIDGISPKILEKVQMELLMIEDESEEELAAAAAAEAEAERLAAEEAAKLEKEAAIKAAAEAEAAAQLAAEDDTSESADSETSDDDDSQMPKKKKKKKKKKTITYDDELGVYITTRQRKSNRSGASWDDDLEDEWG